MSDDVPGGFRPGPDPRRNAGGMDPRVRKVKRQLAKMSGKAVARLEELLDSHDPELAIEGLKLWFKYTIPAPKETLDVNVKAKGVQLRPELAARLAALDA